MTFIAESLPGLPALQEELPLLLMLLGAVAGGFLTGLWLYAERLRQAEWRTRRAEAMAQSLRKLSDDYRKRLNGRSPQQAEEKLKEQERKIGLLRFQVASLSNELSAARPTSPVTIDLTATYCNAPLSGQHRC